MTLVYLKIFINIFLNVVYLFKSILYFLCSRKEHDSKTEFLYHACWDVVIGKPICIGGILHIYRSIKKVSTFLLSSNNYTKRLRL